MGAANTRGKRRRAIATWWWVVPLLATVHANFGLAEDSSPPGTPSVRAESSPYAQRWYAGAVVYEVMIRSFADSNGDGIGDIRGLIDHLDYLNTGEPGSTTDLKVDALWLMPCFLSPSYHGYDTTDYFRIDPVYGTLEDFQDLIEAAHARHIRVLLDLVLNHTSDQHPWFVESASGPDSPRRDWYVWSDQRLDWHQPWSMAPTWHERGGWYYYGLFWAGMPDLNYRNPDVADQMIAIGRHWLEQGADGYRLDAIRYLFEDGKDRQADCPETHAYLRRFAAEMHRTKPDVLLVGEVWSNTRDVWSYFGNGGELDLAFGFDQAAAIKASVATGNPRALYSALAQMVEVYREPLFNAPFLSNHDMVRVATELDEDRARLKLAASVLLSLPGTPFLYQGEEIGLTQGPRPGDEGKRTPMQWDTSPNAGFTRAESPWNPLSGNQKHISVAAQLGDERSLLTHYQGLIRQRRSSTALRVGHLSGVGQGTGKTVSVLHFERAAPGEIVLCVFNFGKKRTPRFSVVLTQEGLEAAGLTGHALQGSVLGYEQGRKVEVMGTAVQVPAMRGRTATWVRVRQAD